MPAWLVPGPIPAEFATDERCFIIEELNLPESPEASLARARVLPGVTTRLHAVRGTVERYLIVKGEGIVEVAGETARVSSGDRIVIPAGVPQRISNVGEEDLEFLCLCTPRFRPEAYVDLEASP